MKKNGFTLVEILAVLVIIAALAIISVPSIINYINNNKNEVSEVNQMIIFSGAELYMDANKQEYSELSVGEYYCIQLKDIVDSNFLESPLIDSVSGEEIDLNRFVKVSYMHDEILNNIKK